MTVLNLTKLFNNLNLSYNLKGTEAWLQFLYGSAQQYECIHAIYMGLFFITDNLKSLFSKMSPCSRQNLLMTRDVYHPWNKTFMLYQQAQVICAWCP